MKRKYRNFLQNTAATALLLFAVVIGLLTTANKSSAQTSAEHPSYIQVDLKNIREHPEKFHKMNVEFQILLNKTEGVPGSSYFPLSPEKFVSFSAWESDSPLWKKEAMTNEFPYLFISKNHSSISTLLRTSRFSLLTIKGTVQSNYASQPWIQVRELSVDRKKVFTRNSLKALIQGTAHASKHQRQPARTKLRKGISQSNMPAELEQKVRNQLAALAKRHGNPAANTNTTDNEEQNQQNSTTKKKHRKKITALQAKVQKLQTDLRNTRNQLQNKTAEARKWKSKYRNQVRRNSKITARLSETKEKLKRQLNQLKIEKNAGFSLSSSALKKRALYPTVKSRVQYQVQHKLKKLRRTNKRLRARLSQKIHETGERQNDPEKNVAPDRRDDQNENERTDDLTGVNPLPEAPKKNQSGGETQSGTPSSNEEQHPGNTNPHVRRNTHGSRTIMSNHMDEGSTKSDPTSAEDVERIDITGKKECSVKSHIQSRTGNHNAETPVTITKEPRTSFESFVLSLTEHTDRPSNPSSRNPHQPEDQNPTSSSATSVSKPGAEKPENTARTDQPSEETITDAKPGLQPKKQKDTTESPNEPGTTNLLHTPTFPETNESPSSGSPSQRKTNNRTKKQNGWSARTQNVVNKQLQNIWKASNQSGRTQAEKSESESDEKKSVSYLTSE